MPKRSLSYITDEKCVEFTEKILHRSFSTCLAKEKSAELQSLLMLWWCLVNMATSDDAFRWLTNGCRFFFRGGVGGGAGMPPPPPWIFCPPPLESVDY